MAPMVLTDPGPKGSGDNGGEAALLAQAALAAPAERAALV